MEILNASDAKREFGELLMKVQKAPVQIHKNGKPVAVVFSADDYEAIQQNQKEWLRFELQRGLDDLEAGRVVSGDVVFKELRSIIDE
jgi:prevent-host-death family protein